MSILVHILTAKLCDLIVCDAKHHRPSLVIKSARRLPAQLSQYAAAGSNRPRCRLGLTHVLGLTCLAFTPRFPQAPGLLSNPEALQLLLTTSLRHRQTTQKR